MGLDYFIFYAEALKQTCDQLKASVFLGRYGGDEFTIIIRNPNENEYPEQAAALIRSALSQKREENQLPYDLEVSIGYEELKDKEDTIHDCMARADDDLYKEKRKKLEAGDRKQVF